MGLLKVTAVMKPASGLSADNVVNTFFFQGLALDDPDAPSGAEIDAVKTRINNFYNGVSTIATTIGGFIGEQISRVANAHTMDFYWTPLDDVVPVEWGSPYAVRSWGMGTALGTTPMPSEVAAVLSFHGDLTDVPETEVNPTPPPATIRPRARRRGRVFIGPLSTNAGSEDASTHEFLLAADFRTTLADAGSELIDANDADWHWVVASKADQLLYDVVGGWVDNAFDTQRRRGQAATARTSWS